jgi:acetyl esterase/lipase
MSRIAASGKAEDRLLLGFSKSGWGVVSLLLRDPAFFGAACSWDAPLMMTEAKLGWASKNHFGTPEQAAPYVPVTLVKKRARELAGGPPRLTILGSSYFGPHTRAFHELLEREGVPHRFNKDLRFKHHWESGWVPQALDILLADNTTEETDDPPTKEQRDHKHPKVDVSRVPLIKAMLAGIVKEPAHLPWRLYIPPAAAADHKLPLVFFLHGANDKAVRVEHSRAIIAALKNAGGDPKYTELPNVGHGSWRPAFDTPKLFQWLFAQRLSERALPND